MFVPIMTEDGQCRTDIVFASPSPFVDCAYNTHYLIHKLIYTPCRGAFLNAGQSQDSTFFSSNVYAWNSFPDSTFLIL